MVFIQEYRCVPNFAFSGTYLAKRVPDLPFWGTYQKDLFLHIEQEKKHILCNIAESNRASLHNPKSVIRKTALYITNSYLINLFRGEPLKNCSVDRLPDILARQYQVVQTVGNLNLRHIRAKTFAIF